MSLKDSGAYTAAAERLSSEASNAAVEEAGLPLDTARVKQAASSSFPPETVEQNSEQLIDSVYDWLQGTTEQPQINIDLQPYTAAFTQSVGNQTVAQVQGLPVCTLTQLRQIDPNNLDIASLPCLPPGINLETTKQQAIDKVVASNEFLQNPVVTTDNLPKDDQGNTVFDNAKNVPAAYQWSMRLPFIFGAFALLSATAVIALGWNEWRVAAKRLAWPLVWTGAIVAVASFVIRAMFDTATEPDGVASRLAGGDFKEVILAFLSGLEQAYTGRLLMFGIIYLVIGIVVLVIVRLMRKQPVVDDPIIASTAVNMPTKNLDQKQNPPDVL